MSKRKTETWLALLVVGIGLIPLAILGRWAYVSATATPLHPVAKDVPSAADPAPVAQWSSPAEQGRDIVRTALTEQNLPAMSIAVGVDGDLVWAEAFGWSDLEGQLPVSPGTQFRLGTASVPLTSAAVGLLLEDGRIKLDEPIQTYVAGFPVKPSPVTVRQLMAHVAGVRNDGGDEGPLLGKPCEQTVDALSSFADSPLRFEPGTRFAYSSYGWILVSAAVEAAASEALPTFLRKRVIEPLGLTGTTTDWTPEPGPNRATQYFPRFAADPRYGLHLMRPVHYSCYSGSSGLVSTPSDLVRFAMAIGKGRLLRPATVELLQTPQQLASGEGTGYGLGWKVDMVTLGGGEPTRRIGHDGTLLGGSVASLMLFPDTGIAVAVISNISYAETEAVGLKIAQAFAGVPKTSRPDVSR